MRTISAASRLWSQMIIFRCLKTFFKVVRQLAPIVVFFDELDTLTPKEKCGQLGVEASIRQIILTELQDILIGGISVIFIAATNHPELIRPSVLSRFTRCHLVGLPTPAMAARQIEQILAKTSKVRHCIDETQFTILGEEAVGLSGRDIYSAVTERISDHVHERNLAVFKLVGQCRSQRTARMLTLSRWKVLRVFPAPRTRLVPSLYKIRNLRLCYRSHHWKYLPP